ncbi:MAG: MFS transporter [Porcipelethomonas sp.]
MKNTLSTGYKKFLLLWSGEFISAVGGGLSSFGLSVYVFQQTGSAASTALVALLAFLPSLLLGVPAGVLADRFDRRALMMIGDGCSALGLVYILICMMDGNAALWQICTGVVISSVFSSLLEPAYKATVTDLLTKDEYTKASGLVGLAGSARYLVSPVLAGILLAVSDIRLLLVIDIATFVFTVAVTGIVRKGLEAKKDAEKHSFAQDIRDGWNAVTENKGVLTLIIMTSFMTFAMGVIQTLSEPMILGFADSSTLGIAETVCACGMLVSSLVLGIFGMKKNYVTMLCLSLFASGLCMILFGWKENIILICIFGFLFFAMLPFANGALDYLIRTNISEELQGRAWGLIGLISQIGYVFAYGLSGMAADSTAKVMQSSVGRGAGLIISAAGVLLLILTVLLYFMKNVRKLES